MVLICNPYKAVVTPVKITHQAGARTGKALIKVLGGDSTMAGVRLSPALALIDADASTHRVDLGSRAQG